MKKLFCAFCFVFMCSSAFAQEQNFEKAFEFNGGVGLDDCINYSFGANFVGGIRPSETIFIGAGVGYAYIDGLYYTSYEYLGKGNSLTYDSCDVRNNLQVFARGKMNFSTEKISPFVSLDLGGTFGLSSNNIKMANGFIFEPAFGIDIKMANKQSMYIMLGYKGCQYEYERFDLTYGRTGTEMENKMAGTFCLHIGFNL